MKRFPISSLKPLNFFAAHLCTLCNACEDFLCVGKPRFSIRYLRSSSIFGCGFAALCCSIAMSASERLPPRPGSSGRKPHQRLRCSEFLGENPFSEETIGVRSIQSTIVSRCYRPFGGVRVPTPAVCQTATPLGRWLRIPFCQPVAQVRGA